jgi:hypothetical protein
MAKLLHEPYPGDWEWKPGVDFNEHHERTNKMLDEIAESMVRFPVADGYALYAVISLNPPILQHIPFGDAWQIPAAHIRGLTAKDIKSMLEREKSLKSLFS